MKKISANPNLRVVDALNLAIDASLVAPGDRIAVAVSGGADSIALLRALLARREELGIVLRVLHVEHGLRGEPAARDATFVSDLAERFHLPCDVIAVDTPARAAEEKESIEEAARNLRYRVFRDVLGSGKADKIATAHTLDDQAETVLMKLLRGAWTEGLSGIHPILALDAHVCIRPLLNVTRVQVEAYLTALDQPWCEDETNRSAVYTRNRLRHELLPALRAYNPRISSALAHIAANARAEEQHWQAELARVLPQLLLPGKPARGGGRSVATTPGSAGVAIEVARLNALDPGLRRRVLRAAVKQCGATLDFDATESLLEIAAAPPGRAIRRLDLLGGIRVERSVRELRLERAPANLPQEISAPTYFLPVPGTLEAPAFGARYTVHLEPAVVGEPTTLPPALLRAWRPGDRVTVAHSSGPKKVKEVLERMGIHGSRRVLWPVVVWRDRIVWMRGVAIAPERWSPSENQEPLAGWPMGLKITETIC